MVHDPGRIGGAYTHYSKQCLELKSVSENVGGMSWRFTALQDFFKPITYAMGAEDSEDASERDGQRNSPPSPQKREKIQEAAQKTIGLV